MPNPGTRQKLFLIDGSALAYRSHFAFIKSPLRRGDGMVTSAVYGFITSILKLLEEEKPDYIAVAFDSGEPTFRHDLYAGYKATRDKMPEDMIAQLPYIQRFVETMRIPFLRFPGIEADDVIASAADLGARSSLDCFLVTGDKDFMQVLGPGVFMYIPRKGGAHDIVGPEEVRERFGFGPEAIADLLALMGDASDNIPGVRGIGEKTAVKLLQDHGSLDRIYENLDSIKGKVRENLEVARETAYLSKDLATIRRNIDIGADLKSMVREPPDHEALNRLLLELDFGSLAAKPGPGKCSIEAATTPGENGPTGGYPIELHASPLPVDPALIDVTADYSIITPEGIPALLSNLLAAPEAAFDLETTSLDPYEAQIVGLSFCAFPGKAAYVPCQTNGLTDGSGTGQLSLFTDKTPKTDRTILRALAPFFDSTTLVKGGQNLKFDLSILKCHDVEVAGIGFDTMIESYLIDPTLRGHNIDNLSKRYLGYEKIPTKALIGDGRTMDKVDLALISRYACEDADMAFRLHRVFAPVIESLGMGDLYQNLELPLIKVLMDMELNGILIDTAYLKVLETDFAAEMDELQKEIWQLAGEEFNINSPKQLGPVLFEKLEIQSGKKSKKVKKTRTGQISTDSAVLETFSDIPIAAKILDYRSLAKLLGTYVTALPGMTNLKTGRIHTSFNQTVTATGRLSSSNPNLQNIPIRTPLGRKIRKAFIGGPGKSLLSADYSQIELRVLAHLCQDPDLIEAFRQDIDIHRHTASKIFGVPMEEVTPEMRGRAKTINFGILYGMGPTRLAKENEITLQEARDFISDYFEKYPSIKAYTEHCVAIASAEEATRTALGRRRSVPEINSRNQAQKVSGEHIALNTPIQGTAADIMKLAMLKVHETLREKMPEVKMLLQVHDELVFEVPTEKAEKLAELVKTCMENAFPLAVPLKAEAGWGINWFDAH